MGGWGKAQGPLPCPHSPPPKEDSHQKRRRGHVWFGTLRPAKTRLPGASPDGLSTPGTPGHAGSRHHPPSFFSIPTAQHRSARGSPCPSSQPVAEAAFPSRHVHKNKREICNSFPKRSCLFLLSNSASLLRLRLPFPRPQLPCLTTQVPAPTPTRRLESGSASGRTLTHAHAHTGLTALSSEAHSGARKVPCTANWKDSICACVFCVHMHVYHMQNHRGTTQINPRFANVPNNKCRASAFSDKCK